MSLKRLIFYSFFLAQTATWTLAFAEQTDATGSALIQIPIDQLVNMEVASTSKIARQISDAPSAVSIVTADDIKSYGYHTLAEILESMRGLYITNDRAYSFLGGRGFGRPGDFTGRIMLLVDGIQVNNNIYDSTSLGTNGLIDTSLIERVEYVSGPGSAVYGNNAFFGIINVVTKHGHNINGLQVTGEVGSYNSRDIKMNYGKRLENGADILLSASGFSSPGQTLYFPDAVGPGNDGISRGMDGQQNRRLFGKVEWDGWFAEMAYSIRKKDIPTAPYHTDFNAPYNYEDMTFEASLKNDRQLSDTLGMSLRAYYNNNAYHGLETFGGVPWNEKSIGQWWGANAQFVGTWFQNQRAVFGSEFRYDTKQEISNPISYLNTDEKTLSLYAQNEITLPPHWMANVGARYDANEDVTSHVSGNISPRLVLFYQPWDTTTLKLSWSTAFRRANPFEKYYTDGFLLPNSGIRPESIEATELVVEHHFDNNTRLQSSVYHYQTDDYITSVNLGGGTSQFQNVKGGSTDGVELEFEKHWDNGIRLRTSAAFQNAENGSGAWPANSPRQIGKFNLSVPFLENAWRAGFEMQAYSDRKTESTGPLGVISVSGYTLANLTLTADHLLPNLTIALGIRNLFDRNYVDVAPTSNQLETTIPQDGRTYWLRMTYDFR